LMSLGFPRPHALKSESRPHHADLTAKTPFLPHISEATPIPQFRQETFYF